ncbi:hypothetical protein SH1V18_29610 [Vallitalea longa]|uniref:Uncharacterized protein n=1 Tax=Vallitalea longa TaxID=2936439 RepID=A0A9W6DES1_9FIRM|nr:hypothetical protein [Vallitalea longa]GKX30481.1 hypothetical protein SH1V18_29610 [Vallitalea longa]
MLNRAKLLKLNIRSKKTKIVIPIPLIIFSELLDCVQDLIVIVAFIVPNIEITIKEKKYSIKSILNIINDILEVLRELKHCEAFDLVDVKSGEDIVKISLK